jgi:hypothetical protein
MGLVKIYFMTIGASTIYPIMIMAIEIVVSPYYHLYNCSILNANTYVKLNVGSYTIIAES